MDSEEAYKEVEEATVSQLENSFSIECLSKALLIAARRGNCEIVNKLIENGALPDKEDDFGYSTLMFVAARGLYKCTKRILLMPGSTINKRTHSRQTALHLAARKGQEKIVELLIEAKAIVNSSDDWGETPLIAAVKSGCPKTVEALLQNGARPEMTDIQGFNAITHAARLGYVEILCLLIAQAQEGDCAKVLKTTPLHQAATFGHVLCVDVLLRAYSACTVFIRDIHGQLPVDLATHTDQVDVVSLFLGHGMSLEDRNSVVATCAKFNSTRCLKELLFHGASPDGCDLQGVPALYNAISQNNIEIIKILIQYNVNVNRSINKIYLYNIESIRDTCNRYSEDTLTPAMLAALCNHQRVLHILIHCGAKVTPQGHSESKVMVSLIMGIKDRRTIVLLKQKYDTPLSLTGLCRLLVRKSLSIHVPISEKICKLPIPKQLIEFLNFSELSDM